MKITVIGAGYVGLVTGACFADVGNDVLCIDVDTAKVQGLLRGEVPIHEPGLDEVVARNLRAGRLHFSSDYDRAVAHSDVFFIAVGTPTDEDGSADVRHVENAARDLGQRIRDCRRKRGLSQEQLAFDAGVDRSYVGGLERREENPTVDILDRLAKTLSVAVSEFFVEPAKGSSPPKPLKSGRRPSR